MQSFEVCEDAAMQERLQPLARAVVKKVNPPRQHREDCFQAAYAAGLMATRSAERQAERQGQFAERMAQFGQLTDSRYLFLCMQSEVYRYLRAEQRQSCGDVDLDGRAARQTTHHVECRDFLDAHLSKVTDKQRQAIELVYLAGLSIAEAAAALGVERNTVYYRLQAGIAKLRGMADA